MRPLHLHLHLFMHMHLADCGFFQPKKLTPGDILDAMNSNEIKVAAFLLEHEVLVQQPTNIL